MEDNTRPSAGGGRDKAAGVKLIAGLLRLDDVQPEGFTAQDLADHTGVLLETVRSYLQPRDGVVLVDVVQPDASSSRTLNGRPPNLYRLRPQGKEILLQRLAGIRREIDKASSPPRPPPANIFTPLDLLETELNQLEQPGCTAEERRCYLEEAKLELGGCEADLRALKATNSPEAADFAKRLDRLKRRFVDARRRDPGPKRRDPQPGGDHAAADEATLSGPRRDQTESPGPSALNKIEIDVNTAMDLVKVSGLQEIDDLIEYERDLKDLRMVIIASDSPAPPDGEMRAMMKNNIFSGINYLFIVPKVNGVTRDLAQVLRGYRELDEEISRDERGKDHSRGRIETLEYPRPKELQHLIFYKLFDDTLPRGRLRTEVLIRQGNTLDSRYLLIKHPSIAETLYLLIRDHLKEVSYKEVALQGVSHNTTGQAGRRLRLNEVERILETMPEPAPVNDTVE